jgi:MFS family permease
VLLLATTCMGLAFGLTVPVINTCAAAFFPLTADRAVLTLNTLLGLGTALAPAFVAVFIGLGFWWGLPVLVAVFCGGLLIFSLPLTISTGTAEDAPHARSGGLPPLFPAFAAATASLALTVFWAAGTGAHLLFTSINLWIRELQMPCPLFPGRGSIYRIQKICYDG